jgi:peptide-methionine (S)-S-oxide reductase
MRFAAALFSLLALAACSSAPTREDAAYAGQTAEAVFAGGCFWCVEHDFEELPGVVEAVSGYTGGEEPNPTYQQVSSETTGHYEAVRVVYDPTIVSYGELVEYFWRHVDPTDAGGQFCDRGPSYRTAIFVTPEQREAAEASKAALEASGVLPGPVVTPVLPLGEFWEAEEYHQDYADRNPVRYSYYRTSCGRDARVREVWARASP